MIKQIMNSRAAVRILLAAVLLFAAVTGYRTIMLTERDTFDGSLYNWLGSRLLEDPFDYSTRKFWDMVKDTLPEGRDKRVAETYLDAPLFKHPPMFSYMLALSKKLFGNNILSSRYVPFFFRILLVLTVFLITKKLFGGSCGVLAAFFTGIDPLYTFCSQKVWIDVVCGFFVYLAILLFLYSDKKKILFYASAVSLGLALFNKYAAVVPMIGIYAFIMGCSDHLGKRDKIIYFFLPVIVLLPWIIWSFRVFGMGLFYRTIFLNADGVKGSAEFFHMVKFISIVAAALAVLLALILSGNSKKGFIADNTGKIIAAVKKRSKYFYGAGAVMLTALFIISFPGIIRSITWGYFPPRGASMHMYDGSPPYFYFYHLIKLSPLYIFSFSGLYFIKTMPRNIWIVILPAYLILLFFGFFGFYESRYVVIAVPGLMIGAVYSIREMAARIRKFPDRERILSSGALIFLVVFAAVKTLYYLLSVVVKNDFIYF